MRKARTRALAALLLPVFLLTSCATSQQLTIPTSETSVTDAASSVRERETGFPLEPCTYDETSNGTKTAERLMLDESGPNDERCTYPQETESEKPDDGTTLGDVVVGALKVLGVIVFVGLCVGLAALEDRSSC